VEPLANHNKTAPMVRFFCGRVLQYKSMKYLFLIVLLGLSAIGAQPAQAVTVYETGQPTQEVLVDFPVTGTATTSLQKYVFRYALPVGSSFDRVVISIPDGFTYSQTISAYLMQDNDAPFSSCSSPSCISTDTQLSVITPGAVSFPTTDTLQQVYLGTTTITSANQYISFLLNPSSPFEDFAYNSVTGYGYSENAYNELRTNSAPALKFCLGSCDNYTFSALPNLTPSLWARIKSPTSGSTVLGGTTLPIQVELNTGTSTANKATLRFTSNNQTLVPYEYDIVTTGLSTFTYNLNLPSFQDSLSFNVTLSETLPQVNVSAVTTRYSFTDISGQPTIACTGTGTSNCINQLAILDDYIGRDVSFDYSVNTSLNNTFTIISANQCNIGSGLTSCLQITPSPGLFVTTNGSNLTFQVQEEDNSLYVSPATNIVVTTNPSEVFTNSNSLQTTTCDESSGLTWAICKTAVYLFYPSQSSIDDVKNLFTTTMSTKAPFVYVTQVSTIFGSMFTQSSVTSGTITVNILGGSLDLISVAQLQAVPFLALFRSLFSAIIWVVTALYIYRRTLLIFNT